MTKKFKFKINHNQKEELIGIIWGVKVARHYSPIHASLWLLIKRSLFGRCITCGRTKIKYGVEKCCPIHDFNPGFHESRFPINPNH